MTPTQPLIILGPTAVGKSALALELARRAQGELISLDSMQIYRGMDIGTAKPTVAEQALCPHHLVDCCDLNETWDVARHIESARAAEEDIRRRGGLPIFVGGTAMYIKALVDGLCDGPAADETVRAELHEMVRRLGTARMHSEQLVRVDPVSAQRIHPNDERRIVRALEVYRVTGRPMSDLQTQWSDATSSRYALVGLSMPRDSLYERIEARVDAMISQGLVEEVQQLIVRGLRSNRSASGAIGYAELRAHLDGEYDLARAVELIKRNTRRFAKHQLTWFRKDKRVAWFDVATYCDVHALSEAVHTFLCEGGETAPPPERLT